jgi:predicted metal-dependent phosphotriesterase family hydrolase
LDRWPKSWGGRAGLAAKTVEKLKLVRAEGVNTIVDLTTYDVWRDIRFLDEVAAKSGVQMIAATGQRFFPPRTAGVSMPARTVEGLAAFFRKEVEQGIDGTGLKAGVIKIGIMTRDLTALEETGLRAAARASKATGAPIRTHTNASQRAGESHAVILEDEGISPSRVSFDHSDDSGDLDYFLGLVKRGYSLGMDHVHRGISPSFTPSFERRAECIKLLIDAGFADKIFLSQDAEFAGSLLPGSRTSEVRFILPEFRAAVEILSRKIPGLVTVLPTVPHVAAKVRAATHSWPTPLHIVEGDADKYAAFDAADVALAASGTVTAELALAHTPMVVGYKVGGLTFFLSKFLMTVTHITLINILLEREAVPEFLQSRCTPENLAGAVERMFRDETARDAQVEAMKEFGRRLGEGDEPPSLRAARVLLEFVEKS